MGIKLKKHLFDRELSWLDFNRRVLDECHDPDNPLLEQVRFLAITGSNLDEFCMVRLDRAQRDCLPVDDRPPPEKPLRRLRAIQRSMQQLVADQEACWARSLVPALQEHGVVLVPPTAWTEEDRHQLEERVLGEVLPLLTPVAVPSQERHCGPGEMFTRLARPKVSNLAVNLLVQLAPDPEQGEPELRYCLVQVPRSLPRFVPLPSPEGCWRAALLEEVVRAWLPSLMEGVRVEGSLVFRLSRGADLAVDEELDVGFLQAMQELLRDRGEGRVVRLELEQAAPTALVEFLCSWLEPPSGALFRSSCPLALRSLFALADLPGFDSLRFRPQPPQPVPELPEAESIFAVIRQGDVLLQHPYQEFDPVVRFLSEAADDPRVLAIKQTVYRAASDSRVAGALERAALNGKQVTAMVEVKARFDEGNNIHWARRLERAGAQVVHGVADLKTHCKAALVVRRDPDRIRRYLHLGTGNYNEKTARIYSDLGLLSCDDALGSDLSAVFNALTGWSQPAGWRKLLVGPTDIKPRLLSLIRREREKSSPESPGLIRAKMNALIDRDVIRALYEASRAGVQVQLNVRGICCLRPGVPEVSENIRVVSIVGRYLEHARVFWFQNGGRPQVYLGSADWMPRNLERRVEIIFPVGSAPLRRELGAMLDACFRDNRKARQLQSDGSWLHLQPGDDEPFSLQDWAYRRARDRARQAEERRLREFRPRRAERDDQ